jgi:hypothetical protein
MGEAIAGAAGTVGDAAGGVGQIGDTPADAHR